MNRPSTPSHPFAKAVSAFVCLFLLLSIPQPTLAQKVPLSSKPVEPKNEVATSPVPTPNSSAEPTFIQQLQEYYQDAKDAGTTTASSAAQWFGEQYDSTTSTASEATSAATKWVTDQYNRAVTAGDTTAKSTTSWVVDDISKIGTWEYKILRANGANEAIEKELNAMGKKRWECYAVTDSAKSAVTRFYFKRPHRSYLQQLPAKDLLRLAPLLQGGEQTN